MAYLRSKSQVHNQIDEHSESIVDHGKISNSYASIDMARVQNDNLEAITTKTGESDLYNDPY